MHLKKSSMRFPSGMESCIKLQAAAYNGFLFVNVTCRRWLRDNILHSRRESHTSLSVQNTVKSRKASSVSETGKVFNESKVFC